MGSLAWNQLQGSKPAQANLWRRLQRIGLSGPLSRDLLEQVAEIEEPRQAWRMLLAHLARMIATSELEPLEEGGGQDGRPGGHGQDLPRWPSWRHVTCSGVTRKISPW